MNRTEYSDNIIRLIQINAFSTCVWGRLLRFCREIRIFISLHWWSLLQRTQTAAASVNQPLSLYFCLRQDVSLYLNIFAPLKRNNLLRKMHQSESGSTNFLCSLLKNFVRRSLTIHCTADLLFDWFEWYFLLRSKQVFSTFDIIYKWFNICYY